MQSSLQSQTLSFGSTRTYLVAFLFIMGNVFLPQLVHLLPQGGMIWLPIYFFTLVGTCTYGWRVGLLTVLVSPLANSLFWDMPAAASLPAIMLKSVLLVFFSVFFARRHNKVTVISLIIVVLGYQTAGSLGEWALQGDFALACQDFRMGIPGMIVQIFGGWAVINHLIDR